MPKYQPPESFNTKHPIEEVLVPFNNRTKKPKPTLAQTHPELSKEWHYKKNCGFGPEDFSYGSNISVWWKCSQNARHIWRERIIKRAFRGDNCPYCSHQRVSKSTSLATVDPGLAKEWHPNNPITAQDVLSNSHFKALWQCQKRKCHTWFATVKLRSSGKTGCPHCHLESFYNLKKNPAVFKYFDLEKNKDINPSHLGRRKAVWWRCDVASDHVWYRPFHDNLKFQCPFCRGLKLSVTNSLKALFPNLAKEFHPSRNGKLTAATVTSRSIKMCWWKCSKNPRHIWQSTIHNRTQLGNGCPKCWAERRPAAFRELRAKQREARLKRRLAPPPRWIKP